MKNTLIILLCTYCLLFACQKQNPEGIDPDCRIYLSVGTTETKSPYSGTVPCESEPLDALVCVSTQEYAFPSDGKDGTEDGTIGKHLTAQFQSGSSQLINGAYYNKDHVMPVYFIAMHPQSGWAITDNTNASFTFNGSQDVMFAPHTTGKYSVNHATSPALNFKHLLTWIKLEIQAESEDVATAWGPLESVTIECKNQLSFDINKEFNTTDIEFSNDGSLSFYQTGRFPDQEFPGAGKYEMTTTAVDAAYVLCAPVTATIRDEIAFEQNGETVRTNEYYINIKTSNRNARVPVDLKTSEDTWFSGSTSGKQFTISLTFKMGNNIAVSASITDWETGGIGFGKIEE